MLRHAATLGRLSAPLALAVVASSLVACAPEVASPTAPRRSPAAAPPAVPVPPWQARASIAQGREVIAKGPPVVIRNATLLTAAGPAIARGTVVIEGGKIAKIGPGDLPLPVGAVVVDGTGKFVTPGIIDTHSHLGVYPWPDVGAHADGNEMTDPVFPGAQSADAFWPQDPGIERAVAGGVTTIQVLPGSGNLVGGRAITIKLRPGRSAREMHVAGARDGLKMACGENPKRVYGEGKRTPMSRMGNLALQRSAFLKAQKLARDWAKWRDGEAKRQSTFADKRAEHQAKVAERARRDRECRDDGEPSSCAKLREDWAKTPLVAPETPDLVPPPDRDPGLETLVGAMEGRVLVHVHCYRADDMLAMLALSDDMGFSVRSFHHALEAYKIRDELAKRHVAVSTWADWWGFKMEAYDGIPENAALVHEAGGRAIIHSDSAEGIQRLNQEAAKALASGRRAGVIASDDDAIRWMTINPAWALGIDETTGSLEAGKDADVVVWDKSPLSVYASAELVFVDGVLRWSRREAGTRRESDFEVGQPAGLAPPLPSSSEPPLLAPSGAARGKDGAP